ncbi:MAG: hypothetical protein Q7V19_02825 [Bacteroidales bacterium]|nr:hypothetical protein [Bacteroidales bacterium]
MFFFGLLSTHLPYIILGIIYLVSFSLYSFRFLSQTENNNPEHSISCELNQISKEKDTEIIYVFRDYFETELAINHQESLTVQAPFCSEKKIQLFSFHEKPDTFHHYHPGFCRPPPPVFLS